MKVSIHQVTSGPDLARNASMVEAELGCARAMGADLVCFPEALNLQIADAAVYRETAPAEGQCPILSLARRAAQLHNYYVHLGSLILRRQDKRVVNRSFLIDGRGDIVARYDKIHLFDVDLGPGKTTRESADMLPGSTAVLAATLYGTFGFTICFDLRFSHLWQKLAEAGAEVIFAPAAFSPITGPVHWLPLLKARAIETGCFVIAAAQCGIHEADLRSYGHSMLISPWGEVIYEAGDAPERASIDIDLSDVDLSRSRIPTTKLRRAVSSVVTFATHE